MEDRDVRLSYDITTLSNPIHVLCSDCILIKQGSDYDLSFHEGLLGKKLEMRTRAFCLPVSIVFLTVNQYRAQMAH